MTLPAQLSSGAEGCRGARVEQSVPKHHPPAHAVTLSANPVSLQGEAERGMAVQGDNATPAREDMKKLNCSLVSPPLGLKEV